MFEPHTLKEASLVLEYFHLFIICSSDDFTFIVVIIPSCTLVSFIQWTVCQTWRKHCLIDWLIDWFIDWLIDCASFKSQIFPTIDSLPASGLTPRTSRPDRFFWASPFCVCFSFFIMLFCLVPCGRLSWLLVSFWAHVNIVHRIVSSHRMCTQFITVELLFWEKGMVLAF